MESALSIELAKHVLLAAGIILATGTFSGLLAQKLSRLAKNPSSPPVFHPKISKSGFLFHFSLDFS